MYVIEQVTILFSLNRPTSAHTWSVKSSTQRASIDSDLTTVAMADNGSNTKQ